MISYSSFFFPLSNDPGVYHQIVVWLFQACYLHLVSEFPGYHNYILFLLNMSVVHVYISHNYYHIYEETVSSKGEAKRIKEFKNQNVLEFLYHIRDRSVVNGDVVWILGKRMLTKPHHSLNGTFLATCQLSLLSTPITVFWLLILLLHSLYIRKDTINNGECIHNFPDQKKLCLLIFTSCI